MMPCQDDLTSYQKRRTFPRQQPSLPNRSGSKSVELATGGSLEPYWCFSTSSESFVNSAFMCLAKGHLHALRKGVVGGYMKQELLTTIKKVLGPVALAVAMAVFSPIAALAGDHGGGHAYGGGRGGFGGGHPFAAPSRGSFGGGRTFSSPGSRGFNGIRGREYYAGSGYYGGHGYYSRGYYGPGFGIGIYAPYGYAVPLCNRVGFYDRYGVWRVDPGCAVPYGY
jgi:hypothetical protein